MMLSICCMSINLLDVLGIGITDGYGVVVVVVVRGDQWVTSDEIQTRSGGGNAGGAAAGTRRDSDKEW